MLILFSDDGEEKVTKEKILKQAEDKKAVRDFELMRQKLGKGYTGEIDDGSGYDPNDLKIQELWQRIRLFLNDDDGHGGKLEPKKGMQPARIRFMEAC
jgi:hypothetical protein